MSSSHSARESPSVWVPCSNLLILPQPSVIPDTAKTPETVAPLSGLNAKDTNAVSLTFLPFALFLTFSMTYFPKSLLVHKDNSTERAKGGARELG